jgi:glyoxylase I family protein
MKCNTDEEINKVKDFYISVLGLRIVREWPDGFMIDTGNGYIEIFTNADGEHRLGSIHHFALLTDDVEAY